MTRYNNSSAASDSSEDDRQFDDAFLLRESLASRLHLFARKHMWLLIICTACGLVAGLAVNATARRAYTATAKLELTEDNANQFRLEQASGVASALGSSKVETEIEILKSPRLALEAIKALNLQNDRRFIDLPPGRQWDLNRSRDRQILAATFIGTLNIVRIGRTTILQITSRTTDPELSAQICNKLIEVYREHNFEDNYESTKQVSAWLQGQLSDLKGNLEDSQSHLVKMQKEIGLVGIDDTQSILLAKLGALSASLTQAQSKRLLQEARVVALKSSPPAVVDALSPDPVLSQLTVRKATLNTQLAEASATYGKANPRIKTLQAELGQINAAIDREESTVVQRETKELETDIQGEEAVRSALTAEKEAAFANNSSAVAYALAKQQYEADRRLYEGLEQRLEEAGIIAGLHSSSVRVIESADPPLFPSAPRKRFNMLLALSAGFALGCSLALLWESFDTKVRSVADVEQILRIPLLGVVPRVTESELGIDAFLAHATNAGVGGWSQIAESYRAIRSSILVPRSGSPPKVLLVTSAKPSEGKTSATCLESIILALSGAKVLLIDADLRRPNVHVRFGLPNTRGLSTVLSSGVDLGEVLHKIPGAPNLSILTSGPVPPMPSELLSSGIMDSLVGSLKATYDFIVLDTPPLLTVTDAAILLRQADGVVLVVRFGSATKAGTSHAIDRLERMNAPILGAILNAVDLSAGDYVDYYQSSADYYTTPDA